MRTTIISIITVLLLAAVSSNAQIPGRSAGSSESRSEMMELPMILPVDVILSYSGMTICYDTSLLVPRWVAYELTDEELDGQVPRASGFSMDLNFKGRQAMREDYSNSGWDKGHMAPAGDMKWSEKSMFESFYLTNICPQNHELNGGDWMALEKFCRGLADRFGKVYIVTGPIFTDFRHGTIGERKVAVPDAFFKAVLIPDSDTYHSIGFIMNNDPTRQPFTQSSVSVNRIEQIIGYDLFCNLDDTIEETVESEEEIPAVTSTRQSY